MKNHPSPFIKANKQQKLVTILFLFTLLLCTLNSQAQWHYAYKTKTFGGGTTAYCTIRKIAELQNNRFEAIGNIYYDSLYPITLNGNYDIWLLKLDSDLNQIKESVIGSSADEVPKTLIALKDTGYLVCFMSYGNDKDITCYNQKANGYINISCDLYRYDKHDSLLWSHCYGDTVNNSLMYGDGIREISTGDLLFSMGGFTGCSTGLFPRIRMLDAQGNFKWKICGAASTGLGYSLCTAEDAHGKLYMATGTNSPFFYFPSVASQLGDIGLLKFDTSGAVSQAVVYGGNGQESIHKIIPQSNGDLILVLSSSSTMKKNNEPIPNYGSNVIWLMRVDSLGNILEENFVGGNLGVTVKDAIQLKNGNILIAGDSKCNYFMNQDSTNYHPSVFTGATDIIICEVDSDFNYIGARSFGGNGHDIVDNLIQDREGSIFIVGTTASSDGDIDTTFNSYSNGWIIKLFEDSLLGLPTQHRGLSDAIKIYPNPSNGLVNLHFGKDEIPKSLELLDVRGKILYSSSQLQQRDKLDVQAFSKGVYLLRFSYAGGETVYKKLLRMD